jgi:hypothetical protein
MDQPTLIYCADGNRRFAEIAIDAGYHYGAQLPNTVYFQVYFADQNWKRPNRTAYMAALAAHRPTMASVLDWTDDVPLPEVLEWAEEAAQYVETVMIIPKVQGGVSRLPRVIGGKPVRLGYSVPTKYGGTELHLAEFVGWPVHLLGGSPNKQLDLAKYLNAVSADGNLPAKIAMRYAKFWQHRRWVSILAADGQRWNDGAAKTDAPYEAFRRSCENIMAAWRRMYSRDSLYLWRFSSADQQTIETR